MLQKLRDKTNSPVFKVLVAAIIITMAIFGFGALNLFVGNQAPVATVNGEDISPETLQQEAERERRRLAMQLGENFDPSQIDPARLQSMALDQLIARTLLIQEARDLGLGSSSRQVNETIISNPNFQIDGRFEENTYRRVVQMMGYTPKTFMDLTAELLTLDQLRGGIVQSAFVTDSDVRQAARLLQQQRDLAYLTFTVADAAKSVTVSDDDVALRYHENERDYMTDESVDVRFVELSVADLMNDESIVVSDDDLLAAYQADKAANPPQEKRDARHILLEINDKRSAEEAKAEIEKIRQRILAGESFEALAREYSEDPGSAESGGELGATAEGVYVPEFETALWSLKEGEISEPVKTEFGYHLIQLNAIIEEEYPPFEQVRADIERRLRHEQAETLFRERERELDNLAFEHPDSLDELAASLGLEIQSAEGITREEGSGIFGNVNLRDAVFADEVIAQGYNTPAVEYVDGRAVVARVVDRHEPALKPLETVDEQIRTRIVNERARQQAQQAAEQTFAKIEAGESVAEVAADAGLQWETIELARRNQPGVPREVLDSAFGLLRPVAGGKRVGQAGNAAGDRYVVTVTRVQDGDVATMSESEIAQVRGFLARREPAVDFEAFYKTLEDQASIRRAD